MTKTLDELVHSNIWDSRDAIERIEELEAMLGDSGAPVYDGMEPDDHDELLEWLEFLSTSSLPADWEYGETFIADEYFEDYARDLADDIGAIDSDAGWPTSYIDWEAAADALKMDYTEYELGGYTFWARS